MFFEAKRITSNAPGQKACAAHHAAEALNFSMIAPLRQSLRRFERHDGGTDSRMVATRAPCNGIGRRTRIEGESITWWSEFDI
jgi:hypothetical protein